MQTGSVGRHGDGWRGRWREDGRLRTTSVYQRKGEAREALNRELERMRLGDRYRPPITLRELGDRWLAQYTASPVTVKHAQRRLVRPLAELGDAQAADVTTEAIQRFLASAPVGKAFKRDLLRSLRAVYAFGVDAGLVDHDPAKKAKAPKPARGERILPFESWAEVETVAEECGRWGPMVIFMADTGARPAEVVAVEHKHVAAGTVELPGSKTEKAWRTVHLTGRGVAAVNSMPRSIATRHVFNVDGRPISWPYFYREIWHSALEAAGLEYRAPYNLRHTFALFSLRAGVPIADLAREMGHESVERTYAVYGGWCSEMGERAASLREQWARRATQTVDAGAGE